MTAAELKWFALQRPAQRRSDISQEQSTLRIFGMIGLADALHSNSSDETIRPMPRLDRSDSVVNNSAMDRASRSDFVTTCGNDSPFRLDMSSLISIIGRFGQAVCWIRAISSITSSADATGSACVRSSAIDAVEREMPAWQ